ncbi:MAG TPA: VOC family protein [Chloroflexota bacterium]|nr:VOC family protein [Chloroflexota bacterium]
MDVLQMRVVVRVRDVENAVRFYRDALGLRVVERWAQPGPGAIFDTGRGQIQVYASSNGAEEPPLPPPTILLVTPDADREHARLASVGVHALWGPATTGWGTRQFAVQDPDGTTLVFCSRAVPPSPPAETLPGS